jgi:hypothetical protein
LLLQTSVMYCSHSRRRGKSGDCFFCKGVGDGIFEKRNWVGLGEVEAKGLRVSGDVGAECLGWR